MKIEIPEFCLVAFIGTSSGGKTTFAHKHFENTQILSSDAFRGMVTDDETDHGIKQVTADAFELLYHVAEKRLSHRRTTVIDATNLIKDDRKKILELAKRQDVHAAAIVLDIPEKTVLKRNAERSDRNISERKIKSQLMSLKQSIKSLKKEGFRFVYVLKEDEVDNAEIVYTKLWSDKKDEHGPFDIIGDVHGCLEELTELLAKLGYLKTDTGVFYHPEGRKAVFLGDLCDRGPYIVGVLRLVMAMVKAGTAYCVPGNHDNKLERYLLGRNVQINHGLEKTVSELEKEDVVFRDEIKVFLSGLVSHYIFDDEKLVVSHAGIRQEYIGRASARIREFCLYGDTTGETDDLGLPIRLDWAEDYRGRAMIVYGHTPNAEVRELNNTYCIDTGCAIGGKLTCLRYPEKEIVSVQAHRQYYEPVRPLANNADEKGSLINAADLMGRIKIETSLMPPIVIPEQNTAAAFEIMSRFACDPHWLIYLPPTMSPCETSNMEDYLEYPAQAFEYFKKNGVKRVVCEKKHMGSRAVIILCHTKDEAGSRFGITDGSRGIIYTRTGRRFFDDKAVETELLDRADKILTSAGFWEDFNTQWICLDTELMPWSEKAQALLRQQYGPTGRAGREALNEELDVIRRTMDRFGDELPSVEDEKREFDLAGLAVRYQEKKAAVEGYVRAYREYCWSVESVEDIRIAPFHLLACEGHVFSDKPHLWHMEQLQKYLTGKDEVFMSTDHLKVELDDDGQIKKGIQWWLELTGNGGEGMVIKPEYFTAFNEGKLIQPAVKCRGREYLRIIYGPEYLIPDHLIRLKDRSLSRKRNLALREFSLGIEALKRFVAKEPLRRVHECVFGVLAFESEPVDPRL